MCSSGNGATIPDTSTAMEASTPASHPESNDQTLETGEAEGVTGKAAKTPTRHHHHEGSDDETSDPVVVSPASSPKPSNSSVGDDVDEIFQDAKADACIVVPPPPSFISLGLRRKATPLSLKSWTSLALTLDGRDKITKVFQYAARFLAWWFAGAASNKHLSLRFANLYKSLSNSRKAFRLGRSFIELVKIGDMGVGRLLLWHLQNTMGIVENETSSSTSSKPKGPPKTFVRRASSNIGWGPLTLDEEEKAMGARRQKQSFVRSMSMKAYRAIYRPLHSTISSVMGDSSACSASSTTEELWTVIGSVFKMLGLFGFWAGDNVNYLYSTGFLDDHTIANEKERLEKRKQLATLASERANQAYFGGSIAGLLVSAYSYLSYSRGKLAAVEEQWREACEEGGEEEEHAKHQLKKAKEKQFSLFLALVKSCCDVIVFSNNPGIDLHEKWRGKKNHEGLHCLFGLISAGTVLYNNFPDA